MLVIESVDPGGLGGRKGLQPGDRIVSINGHAAEDYFDYQFHIGASRVVMQVRRTGREFTLTIRKPPEAFLDISFRPFSIRRCGNRCIFCFVDQLPAGVRPGLGIKDEDYRLSFLYGNYITGTKLTDAAVTRIIRLSLSPLYISVHATDPAVRGMMLGRKKAAPVMPLLGRLADAGIALHTQIVLCPGINDGTVLERTVADLNRLYPAVMSVALIPVGLTRHRQDLYPLKPVTRIAAGRLIAFCRERQREYYRQEGVRFIYAADELYVRAGLPVPGAASYDGFPQIENGVGMLRDMQDGFRAARRRLTRLPDRGRTTLVTGRAAYGTIRALLRSVELTRRVRVIRVDNRFLGRPVSVSGLLGGGDILEALKGKRTGRAVVLPPNCLNDDGLFIDDMTPAALERALGVPVVRGDYGLVRSILRGFGVIND